MLTKSEARIPEGRIPEGRTKAEYRSPKAPTITQSCLQNHEDLDELVDLVSNDFADMILWSLIRSSGFGLFWISTFGFRPSSLTRLEQKQLRGFVFERRFELEHCRVISRLENSGRGFKPVLQDELPVLFFG